MAGYSQTPVSRKLGIAEGDDLLLSRAPDGFDATLGELPGGAREEDRRDEVRRRRASS